MLWPVGYVNVDIQPWHALVANFSNVATLYKAARAGVDDAIYVGVSRPQVMIHIDDGWNLTLQQRVSLELPSAFPPAWYRIPLVSS